VPIHKTTPSTKLQDNRQSAYLLAPVLVSDEDVGPAEDHAHAVLGQVDVVVYSQHGWEGVSSIRRVHILIVIGQHIGLERKVPRHERLLGKPLEKEGEQHQERVGSVSRVTVLFVIGQHIGLERKVIGSGKSLIRRLPTPLCSRSQSRIDVGSQNTSGNTRKKGFFS
jgi:hypothetical protein